jgi:hypothetical protein
VPARIVRRGAVAGRALGRRSRPPEGEIESARRGLLVRRLAEEADLRVVTGIADLQDVAAAERLHGLHPLGDRLDEAVVRQPGVLERGRTAVVDRERRRDEPADAALREPALEVLPCLAHRSVVEAIAAAE